MANAVDLKGACVKCYGSGLDEEGTCTVCGGIGTHTIGEVSGSHFDDVIATLADISDKIGDGIKTYQIMEATDITEFAALSTTNKTAYRQLISCGVVDLTAGTAIRASLWSMFDAQSTTRANLITLLGE